MPPCSAGWLVGWCFAGARAPEALGSHLAVLTALGRVLFDTEVAAAGAYCRIAKGCRRDAASDALSLAHEAASLRRIAARRRALRKSALAQRCAILARMSAPSIIVRLLLSMVLILNGSAGAMVAAHAMADPARHVGASGAVSGQDENAGQVLAESSCHHAQGVAARTATSDTAAATVGAGPHHASDCCGSADCRSGCAQHCAAAIAGTVVVQSAPIPRVGLMLPLPASHVSPTLPHLIRPPIG